MAFADTAKRIANKARRIPQAMGLRDTRVHLRAGQWVGSVGSNEIGKGVLTNTDVEILPRPHVVQGDGMRLRVGPITPAHVGGGWSKQTLSPNRVNGIDFHLLVTRDGDTRAYAIEDIETEPKGYSVSFFLDLVPLDHAAVY